jgi:hypothetical protein
MGRVTYPTITVTNGSEQDASREDFIPQSKYALSLSITRPSRCRTARLLVNIISQLGLNSSWWNQGNTAMGSRQFRLFKMLRSCTVAGPGGIGCGCRNSRRRRTFTGLIPSRFGFRTGLEMSAVDCFASRGMQSYIRACKISIVNLKCLLYRL